MSWSDNEIHLEILSNADQKVSYSKLPHLRS